MYANKLINQDGIFKRFFSFKNPHLFSVCVCVCTRTHMQLSVCPYVCCDMHVEIDGDSLTLILSLQGLGVVVEAPTGSATFLGRTAF